MTAAWAAAALLDALRAEVAGVLDDEHANGQYALEAAAAKLATVAAAFHAADGELAGGEGIEPYCATCGAWIGNFYGLAGWRHFCGDPAPGGQRELYEAHDPHVRAAVELLIEHDVWLRRADFTRACIVRSGREAYVNWVAARAFADAGTVASTSQTAILDLAVALGENRYRLPVMGPRTCGRSPPRWPAGPE